MKGVRAACLAVLALGTIGAAAAVAPAGGGAVAERSRLPDGAVYYEIFVRSFQDSNGDGIGDLRGVTSRLDYIKALGVSGIWLTPIFKSPSYHGYDASDYRAVQPEYGTMADLDALVAAAHQRGLRVLLDLAINHTSVKHPWFSDRHDWYVWREQDPGWPGPSRWYQFGEEFYYAFFGPHMPDLNLRNPDVVAEVKDIGRYWMTHGIDGFRLDAARYYVEGPQGEADTPETHALLRDLAIALKPRYPRTILVGEVWSGLDTIAPYVSTGRELDLAFHFPFSSGMISSLRDGNAAAFNHVLSQTASRALRPASLAPFLTNHDMVRIATQLTRGRVADISPRLKLAAAALLSQPGVPFIYYGEEIGMTNGTTGTRGDFDKRTPMQWERAHNHGFTAAASRPWLAFSSEDPALTVEDQLNRSDSLLHAYRELIKIRAIHPALGARASLEVQPVPVPQIAAYLRSDAASGENVLVVLNFGSTELENLDFQVPVTNPEILWGSGMIERGTVGTGRIRVSRLAPWAGIWIRL